MITQEHDDEPATSPIGLTEAWAFVALGPDDERQPPDPPPVTADSIWDAPALAIAAFGAALIAVGLLVL